jgi:hypothetical protein
LILLKQLFLNNLKIRILVKELQAFFAWHSCTCLGFLCMALLPLLRAFPSLHPDVPPLSSDCVGSIYIIVLVALQAVRATPTQAYTGISPREKLSSTEVEAVGCPTQSCLVLCHDGTYCSFWMEKIWRRSLHVWRENVEDRRGPNQPTNNLTPQRASGCCLALLSDGAVASSAGASDALRSQRSA